MKNETENEDKSVATILLEQKNMGLMQVLNGLLKEVRDFSQDTLLETMVNNENNEKMTKVVEGLRKDMNKGFKELSFQLSRQSMVEEKASDIPVQYVNLTDESLRSLAMVQAKVFDSKLMLSSYVDEASRISIAQTKSMEDNFYAPMVASMHDLVVSNNDLKDVIVLPALDKSPAINQFKDFETVVLESQWHLKNISSDVGRIYDLMIDEGVKKGSSSDPFQMDEKEEGGGMLDGLSNLLGLKPIFDVFKKGFGKISGFINKLLSPFTKLLKNSLGFIAKKMFFGVRNIFKFFGKGKWFTKIFSFLKPVIKLGAKASKLIPGLGQIITAVTSIWSFTDGLKNAEEIVGKAKEELTYMEKFGAGLSGIISDLTLGFVSAKDIYQWLKKAGNVLMDTLDMVMGVFPKPIQEAVKKIGYYLFDEKEGIFGFLTTSFKNTIDTLMNDGLFAGLKEMILNPFRLLIDIPKKIYALMQKSFDNLNMKTIEEGVTSFVKSAVSFVLGIIKDLVLAPIEMLVGKDTVKKGLDFMSSSLNSFKNLFGDGKDFMPSKQKENFDFSGSPRIANTAIPFEVQKSNMLPIPATTIPKSIEAEQTSKLTQDVGRAKTSVTVASPPVNVVVQQPPQPKSVVRRSKAGTDTVLTLNSASGRP